MKTAFTGWTCRKIDVRVRCSTPKANGLLAVALLEFSAHCDMRAATPTALSVACSRLAEGGGFFRICGRRAVDRLDA